MTDYFIVMLKNDVKQSMIKEIIKYVNQISLITHTDMTLSNKCSTEGFPPFYKNTGSCRYLIV